MNPQRSSEEKWHVDKQVPIALIVTLVLGGIAHTGTLVWWASSVTERVTTLERQIQASAPQGDRLTRVEVKIENIQAGIDRIEAVIRRAPDPVTRPRSDAHP